MGGVEKRNCVRCLEAPREALAEIHFGEARGEATRKGTGSRASKGCTFEGCAVADMRA